MKYTGQDIVEGCIRGNSKCEKEFYYSYAQYIYGISRRYCKDDHQAKDYMQDAFVKIFDNLHKFNYKKGTLKQWISTITINTVLSGIRKKKPLVVDSEELIVMAREDENVEINFNIDKEELLRAIRSLPEGYNQVLNLYVFDGKTHKEIAEIMGIQASSSRSKFTRAKKMLKEKLSKLILVAS